MKILSVTVSDASKAADLVQVSDKVITNTPGYKPLGTYVCLGNPFPGDIPPNSLVTVTISEVDNEESLAAVSYPMTLAGATIHRVPVLEMTPGSYSETEKKFRG